MHRERCTKWPLFFLTNIAYSPLASSTDAALIDTGYRNSSELAKKIVETYEQSSKKFCREASREENEPLEEVSTPYRCGGISWLLS